MERHSEKYFIFQLFPILFFAPYFVKSKNTLKHFLGNTVFSVKFSFTVYRPERKVVITLKVKVLVIQSCLTFCNPMDCSPLDCSVHGISQARILEWVAVPFLQGPFLTKGWKVGFPHCKQILFCLRQQGSPYRPEEGLIIFSFWKCYY